MLPHQIIAGVKHDINSSIASLKDEIVTSVVREVVSPQVVDTISSHIMADVNTVVQAQLNQGIEKLEESISVSLEKQTKYLNFFQQNL